MHGRLLHCSLPIPEADDLSLGQVGARSGTMLQLQMTKANLYCCFIHRNHFSYIFPLDELKYRIWKWVFWGILIHILATSSVVVFFRLRKCILYMQMQMLITHLEISNFSGCKCLEASSSALSCAICFYVSIRIIEDFCIWIKEESYGQSNQEWKRKEKWWAQLFVLNVSTNFMDYILNKFFIYNQT